MYTVTVLKSMLSKHIHGAFAFMSQQIIFLHVADSSKFNVQRSTRDAKRILLIIHHAAIQEYPN
jgi:hypothetical protein